MAADQKEPENGTGIETKVPERLNLHRYSYKGVYLESDVQPGSYDADRLRHLYSKLDDLAQEILDRAITDNMPEDNEKLAEYELAADWARNNCGLSVSVIGGDGEQVLDTSIDALSDDLLPNKIHRIIFDSRAAINSLESDLANGFTLTLDFKDPPGIHTYDPWQSPTPNASQLIVNGPDATWLKGAQNQILDLLSPGSKARRWLHNSAVFQALNWLVGIPIALLVGFNVGQWLSKLPIGPPDALQVMVTIYVVLVMMLAFRFCLGVIRWLYPVMEWAGKGRSKLRNWITSFVSVVWIAILVNAILSVATVWK